MKKEKHVQPNDLVIDRIVAPGRNNVRVSK